MKTALFIPCSFALGALIATSAAIAADKPPSAVDGKSGAVMIRTGSGAAEHLASKLRQLMLEYENAIEAKAGIEEKFYLEQQETLRDLWLPGAVTNDVRAMTERMKLSVPFLTISVNARRAARLMAEELAIDPGNSTSVEKLLEFLNRGLEEDQALFAKAQGEQQRLRIELTDSLAKIELQESLRKGIRNSLLELELAPTLKDSLTQLVKLGEAAEKQLKTKSTEQTPSGK